MERGIRDIFVDALDTAATLAIRERFTEQISENSEGSAEFANPATVTQPVQRSELPSGQPLNSAGGLAVSPIVLAIGGVAVLTLGLVIARVLR